MIILFHNGKIQNKTLKSWAHYSLGELYLFYVNSTLICQRFFLFSLQGIPKKFLACEPTNGPMDGMWK
jgi:hypothetical protein